MKARPIKSYLYKIIEDPQWHGHSQKYRSTVADNKQCGHHRGKGPQPDTDGDRNVDINNVQVSGKAIDHASQWGGVKEGHGCPQYVEEELIVEDPGGIYTT